jgi:hypothetical protein
VLRSFAAVLCLALAPVAHAQAPDGEGGAALEEPPSPTGDARPRRIAVLVLATASVEAETADALSELVIGAVAARGGVTIVGKEEFLAQLGQDESQATECVSSTACLGRVGVELRVDEVVAGTVGRRGNAWIFNINRMDIASGDLAGRAFTEVDGDVGALADAIQAAIPSLYERIRRPATVLVSANVQGAEVTLDGTLAGVYRGEPVRFGDVTEGRHELAVSAAGYFDWSRTVNVEEGSTLQIEATLEAPRGPDDDETSISPLVWIGGAIAVAAGGASIGFGLSSQRSPEGASRADDVEFADGRERDALIANVSLGVAAAGAVTAVIGLLLSDFGSGEAPPVAIRPDRRGASVQWRGTF